MQRDVTVIALYLPQFHPIPENDEWWGRGFTEWTNTAKANPLFRGHYQPHVPADLGFYDLRVPETRAAQADMARAHGIGAFCYYHYWFGGRRLLERPFDEVLTSGKPDFPFCLCWANETWTGIWHGAPGRTLVEQTYPGAADFDAHFRFMLRAFRDPRYLTVDGRPVFMIYRPSDIPDVEAVVARWRHQAVQAGLPGVYFVGWRCAGVSWNPIEHGFDATSAGFRRTRYTRRQPLKWLRQLAELQCGRPTIFDHEDLVEDLADAVIDPQTQHPCLVSNWDNTPRSGSRGLVLRGATPEAFRIQVRDALRRIEPAPRERRIIFVKSWNEWAEGNHLEPDLRDGRAWLEAIRDEIAAWRARQQHLASPQSGEPMVAGEQRATN
jgi:glycosyl transferase family WbsX